MPSSRVMSSLENVNPGINPLFFSQKILAKLPEKKIPSTAENAMSLIAKLERRSAIQRSAHSAFLRTHGMVSTALRRNVRWAGSRMYVSMRREYVSECTFSIMIWKP